MNRKCVFFIILIMALTMKSGFVVTEAANPVTFLVAKEGENYQVTIRLCEKTQLQSFQMRLYYDSTKLQLADKSAYAFTEQFNNQYNGNKSAVLMSSDHEAGKKSSILFMGIQTDTAYSFIEADVLIAKISFVMEKSDVGEVDRALALNTLSLSVEVLENSDGNIIEEEQVVNAVYGSGLEHLNKKEFDENRFTEVGDGADVSQETEEPVQKENGQSDDTSVTDRPSDEKAEREEPSDITSATEQQNGQGQSPVADDASQKQSEEQDEKLESVPEPDLDVATDKDGHTDEKVEIRPDETDVSGLISPNEGFSIKGICIIVALGVILLVIAVIDYKRTGQSVWRRIKIRKTKKLDEKSHKK